MTLKDSLTEFDAIAKVFDELRIDYLLGGSIASSAYGIPRSTQDVDVEIQLNLSQVEPLIERLKENYMIFDDTIVEAIKHQGSFNLLAYASAIKIDILVRKSGKYDEEAARRKVFGIHLDEGEVSPYWVNAVEDVILRKLQWYRLGNEVSNQKWLDVAGVLKAQGLNLDFAYLRHWAAELGISDLLERAFEESGLKDEPDSEK